MDKVYDQKKIEKKWYEFWEKQEFFNANPESTKPGYSILMPPPNLTGEPHAGHTIQHLIMDGLARFKRMEGFDVLLQPGVDHAGIQFEGTLNKLLEKEGLRKEGLGREAWMKRAWQFKDEIYKSFHKAWREMGISADWKREVFTLDPKVQKAVFEEFKRFWDEGLLYKGAYIVQWCPKDATAIEDLEMEYEERSEKLYFVKYEIVGEQNEYITVASARPETIAADVAIAVYPNHSKYKNLVGKKAINPFTNTKIPIIEDARVEKDFGTGALKITPGHDLLDFEIGQTHNLEVLHAVTKDGHITDLDPNLKGLKILEAREKAAQILRDLDLIERQEDYTHSVPICERCKSTIESLVSEEWFVKMKPLAQKALMSLKEIKFFPKNFEKVIADWLEEIHDWSISRSLWWGHRIPVWYCQNCNPNHLVGKDKQSLRPNGLKDMKISLTHPEQNCQTCGLNHWVQDDQILDTWFSSGLWPMATLGWPASPAKRGEPDETKELKKYYPYDFEISAPEIKFLWIARMIMLGLWFKDNIPFKNMFFTGTLRDFQGRKFSKSLGNGVFPLPLIDTWGVDAYRMAIFSFAAPARDGRASKQTLDERCKNFRNFATKLRNIGKFIIDLKPKDAVSVIPSKEGIQIRPREGGDQVGDDKLHTQDKEIIEKLNNLIKTVTNDLDSFNFHLAADFLYEFIWHEFADKYIEQSKKRRSEAQPVLEYVFKTSLELLHPFMPFITEELWQKLPHEGKSIMIAKWPETN